MFQMVNGESTQPQDWKTMIVKVATFNVALLVLGGAVYFFAFLPYTNR